MGRDYYGAREEGAGSGEGGRTVVLWQRGDGSQAAGVLDQSGLHPPRQKVWRACVCACVRVSVSVNMRV